jgi:hypothetical protein
MTRRRKLATYLGAILGAVLALLLSAVTAKAATTGALPHQLHRMECVAPVVAEIVGPRFSLRV